MCFTDNASESAVVDKEDVRAPASSSVMPVRRGIGGRFGVAVGGFEQWRTGGCTCETSVAVDEDLRGPPCKPRHGDDTADDSSCLLLDATTGGGAGSGGSMRRRTSAGGPERGAMA